VWCVCGVCVCGVCVVCVCVHVYVCVCVCVCGVCVCVVLFFGCRGPVFLLGRYVPSVSVGYFFFTHECINSSSFLGYLQKSWNSKDTYVPE